MKVGVVLGMVGLLSCLAVSARENMAGPTAQHDTSRTRRSGTRADLSDSRADIAPLASDHSLLQILPTGFVPIQSKNPRGLSAGKVLVASRDLGDPNFAHTVVLLLRYDAQGVVGLVINRRSDIPLSRALHDVKAAKDRSDPVYLGGPVETPAVFALFRSTGKPEGADQIFSGVYLISAKPAFERIISARPDPKAFHVFLGYAGWTREQLQVEVKLGAWYIFPADAATVFNSDPDSLWFQMIRKTELKFTKISPADEAPGPFPGHLFSLGYSR
jgi:putative transcriptional regulator